MIIEIEREVDKMVYNLNGKNIKIPDEEIAKSMKCLDLSKDEAIQMWLEDEGYLDNEEQNALVKKAKESGILHTIHGAGDKKNRKAPEKPRTVKVSDEKKDLFLLIHDTLRDYEVDFGGKTTILKENKLIQFEINGKIFKIDLIEQRPKKK